MWRVLKKLPWTAVTFQRCKFFVEHTNFAYRDTFSLSNSMLCSLCVSFHLCPTSSLNCAWKKRQNKKKQIKALIGIKPKHVRFIEPRHLLFSALASLLFTNSCVGISIRKIWKAAQMEEDDFEINYPLFFLLLIIQGSCTESRADFVKYEFSGDVQPWSGLSEELGFKHMKPLQTLGLKGSFWLSDVLFSAPSLHPWIGKIFVCARIYERAVFSLQSGRVLQPAVI